MCSCAPGYIGNPPACRPECIVNSDCPLNEACVNLKCRDPCPGSCGVSARCQVVNHNPICSCPSIFTGDPFVRCLPKRRCLLWLFNLEITSHYGGNGNLICGFSEKLKSQCNQPARVSHHRAVQTQFVKWLITLRRVLVNQNLLVFRQTASQSASVIANAVVTWRVSSVNAETLAPVLVVRTLNVTLWIMFHRAFARRTSREIRSFSALPDNVSFLIDIS